MKKKDAEAMQSMLKAKRILLEAQKSQYCKFRADAIDALHLAIQLILEKHNGN